MIIGICGLGFSGSGAVIDLLREYKDIYGFSNCEMSICYYPDGVEDLDYHLNGSHSRYMSSDAALYAFHRMMKSRFGHNSIRQPQYAKEIMKLTEIYIDALSQVVWKGSWGYRDYVDGTLKSFFVCNVLQRISLIIHSVFRKSIQLAPLETMRLSVYPLDFEIITQKYIVDVLKAIGYSEDKKKFVVNQLFSGDDPEKSFKYFNDPYAIVVRRDPRDTYLLVKKMLKVHAGWIPTDNVEDFIKYYRLIYDNIKTGITGKVIQIQYEDLIYSYDETVKKIEYFCLINNHIDKYKYFNPTRSIRYTQLLVDYPQYKNDILCIEKALSEYMYHFPYERAPIKSSEKIII